MESFKEYIQSFTEQEQFIIEYALLHEDELLTEGFWDTIKKKISGSKAIVGKLEKLGITFKKEDAGLIGILVKSGVKLAKALLLIMSWKKAFLTRDEVAKARIKEEWRILSKSINKKELVAFLINLDMVTMHLITGPIHAFKALTGYELEVFHHGKVKDTVHEVIKTVKSKLASIISPNHNIFRSLDAVETEIAT